MAHGTGLSILRGLFIGVRLVGLVGPVGRAIAPSCAGELLAGDQVARRRFAARMPESMAPTMPRIVPMSPPTQESTIASNRNATLGSLHGIGVKIPLISHTTQVVPDAETLFQPFLSCFQVGNVFRPFVAKHFCSSTHLQLESLGKGGIAEEVVPHPFILISMTGGFGTNSTHLDEGTIAMIDTLVNNVEW